MSWRNIKLIFLREVRDQLRDRRTVFMVAVLPLLLYPSMGIGMVYMLSVFHEQPRTVVLLGEQHLPAEPPLELNSDGLQVITDGPDREVLAWLDRGVELNAELEGSAAVPEPLRRLLAAAQIARDALAASRLTELPEPVSGFVHSAVAAAAHSGAPPPAVADWLKQAGAMQERLHPDPRVLQLLTEAEHVRVQLEELRRMQSAQAQARRDGDHAAAARWEEQIQAARRRISDAFALTTMQVLIVVPEGFARQIADIDRSRAGRAETPAEHAGDARPMIVQNSADEKSSLAYRRVREAINRWEREILKHRLDMVNLSESFTDPVGEERIDLAQQEQLSANVWSKLFPALLVIMAVTGAFYPAIDVAAGEKERGTMETLLICPARRQEIVLGKFLTVMLFSAATALLNVLSMGVTGKHMLSVAGRGVLSQMGNLAFPPIEALVWLLILLVPLAALFSALCLALATFARSSKEGQYYLTPLLMLTMGLTLFCLSPGVEITPFYSVMPVMGIALLLKGLLLSPVNPGPLYVYAIPVLVTSIGYSLLALWWAIEQFRREEVLFREAERFELRLWIKHLLREKEPTPSFTEAAFCFVTIMLLQFGAMRYMQQALESADEAMLSTVMMRLLLIQQLAIVATPALLMGVLLTSSVVQTFRLRLPRPSVLAAAILLPAAIHPLSLELGARLEWFFPPLPPSVRDALRVMSDPGQDWWFVLLTFALAPAVCEELAFRGFILSGFSRSGRTGLAVGLSSLTFGAMHMIPQQVFNAALLGVVLGIIAIRGRSLVPCILFHFLYNSLEVLRGRWGAAADVRGTWTEWFVRSGAGGLRYQWPTLVLCGALAAAMLWLLVRRAALPAGSAATAGTAAHEASLAADSPPASEQRVPVTQAWSQLK